MLKSTHASIHLSVLRDSAIPASLISSSENLNPQSGAPGQAYAVIVTLWAHIEFSELEYFFQLMVISSA